MNASLWIGMTVVFGLLAIGLSIFYIIIFRKTHVKTELKAFFTKTPIGMFFQDNKFTEWRPITPVKGVVYDKYYGPFIVSTTYVDKKTKNIVMPFDVDLDSGRDTNLKEMTETFKNVTDSQKNIAELRSAISNGEIDMNDRKINNITSELKYQNLKNLFFSSVPHNIKSKIEKIVSEKVVKSGKVNAMDAVITFGAIFGIIVLAAIILNSVGGGGF